MKRKNTTEYRSLPGMPLSSRSEYSEKFFQRYYHQLLYFLFYRKRALPDKRAPLRYILPNKIRGSTRIFFRQRHSGATIFQRFEHPCHISANVFHNLDALHILLRFTGAHTMNGIPIERRNNQRIGQIKNNCSSGEKHPHHRNGAMPQHLLPVYRHTIARRRNKRNDPESFSLCLQFQSSTQGTR